MKTWHLITALGACAIAAEAVRRRGERRSASRLINQKAYDFERELREAAGVLESWGLSPVERGRWLRRHYGAATIRAYRRAMVIRGHQPVV